jgi:cytochrome d ubiquinol oxidase subunit II
MLATHGAIYLTLRTDSIVQARAHRFATIGAIVTVALFAVAGLWVWRRIDGYAIVSAIVPDGPSNPLLKSVVRTPGRWFANYGAHPWMMIAPVLGFAGLLLALYFTSAGRHALAFIASAVGIFGIIATAGLSMFPFLMPSNIAPAVSLTVWDASSSRLTLFVMLVVTLIFLPIVLVYTAIAFRALHGMITASMVEKDSHSLY